MTGLLRRFVRLVLVLLVVTAASFSMVSLLPGDTVTSMLGDKASAEDQARAREELRLDRALPVRYAYWLSDAVRGDLGRSYVTKQPVTEAISQRLGITLELVLLSQIIALFFAVPMAVAAALNEGRALDKTLSGLSLGAQVAPSYIVAVGLLIVFATKLHWFNPTGIVHLSDNVVEHFKSLTLPALALGVQEIAMYMRLMRTELIDTLGQEYIWMARAKGVKKWDVIRKHALRPSSVGVITVAGVTIGRMIGGTILVEVIFALPGLGRFTVDSINNRDFMALQGAVVVFTVGFVVINFLVDVLYGVLDPRTRAGTMR